MLANIGRFLKTISFEAKFDSHTKEICDSEKTYSALILMFVFNQCYISVIGVDLVL